jgi:hypothetical protein
MPQIAVLALPFLFASLFAWPAFAGPLWTFCVASALGTTDVWITELFPATPNRERLEAELKGLLERAGHSRIIAQCLTPSDDKVSVVNAQTTAEEFNRKLGSTLQGVPTREFPLRH